MESRHQKLLLETDRHRIRGEVTLAREGYRSRISDMGRAMGEAMARVWRFQPS